MKRLCCRSVSPLSLLVIAIGVAGCYCDRGSTLHGMPANSASVDAHGVRITAQIAAEVNVGEAVPMRVIFRNCRDTAASFAIPSPKHLFGASVENSSGNDLHALPPPKFDPYPQILVGSRQTAIHEYNVIDLTGVPIGKPGWYYLTVYSEAIILTNDDPKAQRLMLALSRIPFHVSAPSNRTSANQVPASTHPAE